MYNLCFFYKLKLSKILNIKTYNVFILIPNNSISKVEKIIKSFYKKYHHYKNSRFLQS